MIGDTSFVNVFKEIGYLLYASNISMTKEDIDNLPPFERIEYINMFNELSKNDSSEEQGV